MSNLYLVSTPIGNLQDITLRAAGILLNSRAIIAESTSKAGILLDFLEKQFKQKRSPELKIISMTEDEEEIRLTSIIQFIKTVDASLISEAGTPLISDPGFKLVREAIRQGIHIVPIPGPTALTSAVISSGLPTDKFIFLGFLPKSNSKKIEIFKNLKEGRVKLKTTVIIYESPHRLIDTLTLIENTLGNIDAAVSRELTKIHEETRRGKVKDLIDHYSKKLPKGELVIVI